MKMVLIILVLNDEIPLTKKHVDVRYSFTFINHKI